MAVWKDSEGREWRFEINVWTCREVKQQTGWDLPNILNEGFGKAAELLNDPCEMLSVLLVLVEKQRDKYELTDEDFGRLLAGDVYLVAVRAFQEALADFFPERQSLQLKEVWDKSNQTATALADVVDKRLASLTVGALTELVLSGLESPE